ncbi:AMP-binding protein [Streptomyces albulus]|nr:AMP-binding protein [Streptomyces noursei]
MAARTTVACAGYLAVQRLGATVVPLGLTFPAGRNAAVARAADLDAVLADTTADHPEPLGVPTLTLTDDELAALPATTVPDARTAHPDDLAYLLFTSGSTGVPKGVPVRHRNVCAYLAHVVARTAAGPGDRFSQTFDLTFDPSVHDMFTAWGSGATLVVPTRGELLAPVRFVNRRALTHWNSVPSLVSLAQRLRALKPDSMPTLRQSMFCGEPLTLQQAAAWHRAAPASTLENAYGPTELTVTCVTYRLPADPADWPATRNGTVPIGTPHPGLELRLDDGELCMRGPALPRLPRPDRERRPLPSPRRLAPRPGHRPHRHALVPHRRPRRAPARPGRRAAALVHLGRGDQQVRCTATASNSAKWKPRCALPGIRDAAVLPCTTPGGTELTAAYTTDDPTTTPDGLRTALRDRLPAYMVPASLTALDALPLNRNGKLDRTALGAALAPTP